jgi:hypothetical protein
VRLVPYTDDLVGSYRSRLFVLFGAVGLVHLICCVNVTSCPAWREAWSALHPAYPGLAVLRAAAGANVPRLEYASIDGVVLAFTFLVTVASGVLAGLLPAVRGTRLQPWRALRAGGRAGASASAGVRRALVAAEVALSLVLLIGAGLMIRSAIAAQRVDTGVRADNVWTGRLTLPAAEYHDPEVIARTFDRVVADIGRLPGVQSSAAVSVPPFSGLRVLGLFVPDGRPLDADNAIMGNLRLVSPGRDRERVVRARRLAR